MPSVTRNRPPSIAPTTADVHAPGSVGGNLKDGVALVGGTESSENIVCGGAARLRVRAKATVAGTLALRWLRSVPNKDVVYETLQPPTTPMAANAEAYIDIPVHMGEGRAQIAIIPEADGILNYCDISIT